MRVLLMKSMNRNVKTHLVKPSKRVLFSNCHFGSVVCAPSSEVSGTSYCNRTLSYRQSISLVFQSLNGKRRILVLLVEVPTEGDQKRTDNPLPYQTDPFGVVISLPRTQKSHLEESPLRSR